MPSAQGLRGFASPAPGAGSGGLPAQAPTLQGAEPGWALHDPSLPPVAHSASTKGPPGRGDAAGQTQRLRVASMPLLGSEQKTPRLPS